MNREKVEILRFVKPNEKEYSIWYDDDYLGYLHYDKNLKDWILLPAVDSFWTIPKLNSVINFINELKRKGK